jgi:hypothetical protein
MLRTWKYAVPVLLLSLVGRPVRAAEEFGPEKSTQEKLDAILQGLAKIDVRLGVQDTAIKSLFERVEKLERDNAELRRKIQDNEQRVSRYLDPAARNSVIRLENRTQFPATVILNDRSYPLGPFQSVEVPGLPAGTFTYEVFVEGFGVRQPRVTRLLGQRELFTISVNP